MMKIEQVRWIRVLYSNFGRFCEDQEYLISLHGKPGRERFDYVEGFVIVDEGLINNWRSSFFSPSNPVNITSLNADGGVLYCLEITKNYDQENADSVDEVHTQPNIDFLFFLTLTYDNNNNIYIVRCDHKIFIYH